MLAHHRHDFLGQFLQVIVRFCAEQIAEYGTDTVEHFAGLLIGQHCVGKCRDFRIADDGIYFRILAVDAFVDGGYISPVLILSNGTVPCGVEYVSKKGF